MPLSSRPDYDLIVIGAGHNALISAAYVAQAGYRVAVFERRDIVGGAVSTREIVPGYQFDLGGSAHILIRLTPIIEELGLEQYGLDYIELDPLFSAPFEDGDHLFIWRDVDKTADDLERRFPGEGDAYKRFIDEWTPFANTVKETFLRSPSPFEIGKTFALGDSAKIDWQRAMQAILQPYGDVVDQYFTEEKVKAPLVWMAAQSGPPPTEPLTAPFLLWHPLYHQGGVARPRGGSGMLTQALRRHIEAHGGDVFTSSAVDEILVEDGRASGVRVGTDISTARGVLAGTHILESVGRLLPSEYRPESLKGVRVGNGFGAILRLALSEPVRYSSHPGDDARIGLGLVCRDRQQIMDAYADYLRGEPAKDPPIVAMSFSAVDDSLAPAGGEALWLWGQYFPYELSGGRSWADIEEGVADSILTAFEKVAPGTRENIMGQLFQHPEWLERELGLRRGNVMHVEMSIDQMFSLRPTMDLSQYKGPVDGLFLTGASTHPGGGIMGASGRNAARVVLKALS
ncbi:phytoene desaturase family protein [Rubricoccus marinus]|uniref:Pyridine nucleotide-disulfide oxidoreductase domain-containing protein 2 n=1 Tax=Rubricoccus marinus TaxID=716817 RepID=A0A259TYJ7_9BACT|nr:NAD(P)/FAD-dependent oxidoreductase [Rubricoccus marinus]OZC02781.1 FAD-dependent oxidoreductase [Rubricoccus marinus]